MRKLWKRFSVPEQYQQMWRRNRRWSIVFLVVLVAIYVAFVLGNWAPWTGFKGKTLWEWLDLLGVPLTLAVLGYFLQQQEQKRSREDAKQQREIAAEDAKDEILQAYFDRLSVLLVDKNLLAIAVKLYSEPEEKADSKPDADLSSEQLDKAREAVLCQLVSPEQRELFDVAIDVIRARTLSILRRFQGDGERKGNVIQFLIESEVISKAKLSLREADLSGAYLFVVDLRGANLGFADLRGANLEAANLGGADFRGANLGGAGLRWASLCGAYLISAKFVGADLFGANLGEANLCDADLCGVDLCGAYLIGAKLLGAKLRGARLGGADLSEAYLVEADLCGADLCGAALDGANLQRIRWSPKTVWPHSHEVAKAIGIPERLKQELGIEFPVESEGAGTDISPQG